MRLGCGGGGGGGCVFKSTKGRLFTNQQKEDYLLRLTFI